jgi:hypothetical protein
MMTREYALDLMLCRVQPLPPEDHADWEELALYLEEHPELATWFDSASPADAALSQALQEIDTPPAPTKLPANPAAASSSRRGFLKAAAAVTLLGGGATSWLMRPVAYRHSMAAASYADFCEDMCIFASRLMKLDHKGTSLPPLRSWLSEHSLPQPSQLPTSVASRTMKGCKEVPWGARKVGLICFMKEDGSVVHVFSVRRDVLQSVPDATAMAQATVYAGREVVGWADQENVSVLVPSKVGTSTRELLA